MCRTGSQAFLAVMAVVLVVCVGQSISTSRHNHTTDHQQVLSAIRLNQMALLQEMNESSREGELRELRLLKEATMEQLKVMKEEAKDSLERMKETAMEQLEEMKQETREELQAAREEMEREVKEMLEAAQNSSLSQLSPPPPQLPSQQPSYQDLHAIHDDPAGYISLCGSDKVLHGGRGSLSPSHPRNYTSGLFCRWHVILPEGTRPFFIWEYLNLESCGSCNSDWVMVWAPGVKALPKICGNITTTTHPMHSIMDNEFIVFFRSNAGVQGKGFLLHYAAVLVSHLTP